MTTSKDEKLLYEQIAKTVIDWTIAQNKKGKKPRQSTIVGSLDMVKNDWYAYNSMDRIMSKKITGFLRKWKGKEITIDENGTITILAIKRKNARKPKKD